MTPRRRLTLGLVAAAGVLLAAGAAAGQPPDGRPLPAMPPTPVVQIMVLVPQDAAPGQDVPYTVKVQNTSGGKAHRVQVRMPWPDGAEAVGLAEPAPAAGKATPKGQDLVWRFDALEPNESRTITVAFKPAANAGELTARAYVQFEHGQKVVTRLSAPKLKLKTELPKQAAADGPIPVRVQVSNDGRVAADGVKLTVNVSQGFEYDKDAPGEKGATPQQRVFDLGVVRPGEVRPVAFRLAAKDKGRLLVTTAVNAKNGAAEKDEAKAEVLDAKLRVELKGDPKATGDEPAVFEAVVRNEGSMPLTNVRLTGTVPDDCTVTRRTKDGQVSRDQVVWVIPKLPPGDSYAVRWGLRSSASGRRTVRAAAAARGLEDVASAETVFQGAAALNWETTFATPTVRMDATGQLTVRVNNTGSEAAANVRVTVDLPKEVSLVQATPGNKKVGEQVVFEPKTIPAGRSEVFTLTFRAEQVGKAYFGMRLAADALGDKPLGTDKYIEVVRGR